MKIHVTANKIILILLGICAVVLLVIGYLAFKPYTLYKLNAPITVKPKVIGKKTQSLFLHSDACVKSDAFATTEVFIVRIGSAIKLTKTENNLRPGCRVTDAPLPISLIPEFIENGDYYLRFETTAQVNPFRLVKQSINTETFNLNR